MAKNKGQRRARATTTPRVPDSGPRDEDRAAAEDVLRDPQAAKNVADETERRATFFRRALGPVWDDLTTMIRLLRAYASGDYREVPWATLVMVVAALIYFLSPVDFVMDWIPLVGMVDDVAVLAFVAKAARSDLAAFRAWEERKRRA